MKSFLQILITLISLTNCLDGYSQEYYLNIKSKDSLKQTIFKKIQFNKSKLKTSFIKKEINSINNQLNKLGFLNYSIIKKTKTDSIINITYKLNTQILFAKIKIPKDDLIKVFFLTNKISLTSDYLNIPFTKIYSIQKNLNLFLKKKGAVFNKITLTNISILETVLSANLIIQNKKIRKIDKIIINGYDNFPNNYKKQIYNQFIGKVFNNSILNNLSKVTSTISSIQEIKKPQVLFKKDSTLIYIYLKKKVNNSFNGMIGAQSNKSGKIKLNGHLNLNFENLINIGEQLKLKWQSTDNKDKELVVNINLPYFLKTRINPSMNLSIYVRDSSYLNTQSKTTINYHLNNKHSLGIILRTAKSTSLLTNEITNILNFNKKYYGIHYAYKNPSQNIFYQNDSKIDFEILNGKNLINNTKQNQSLINLNIEYLVTLNTRNSIMIKNHNSLLISDLYALNEQVLIGGQNNIRGFQENSIPATKYSIINIDYNYAVNPTTKLYTITDIGKVKNNITEHSQYIYGIGLGYKTKLKTTVLNINYSFGGNINQRISDANSILNINIKSFF